MQRLPGRWLSVMIALIGGLMVAQPPAAARLPLPSTQGYEVRIYGNGGAIHRLYVEDLYSEAEIAQTDSDLIDRVLNEADVFQREAYRQQFVARLQTALPSVDVTWIEFWWQRWPVHRGQTPSVDRAHPAESRLVLRAPGEFYYVNSPQQTEVYLEFGDSLGLLDHHLLNDPAEIAACDTLFVLSGWRVLKAPAQDYQITLVLVGLDGMGIAQDDGPLAISRSSQWQPGEEYLDRRSVTLPCDLEPGIYRLMIGLYDLETIQNLPVSYPGGPEFTTLWILAEIKVAEAAARD